MALLISIYIQYLEDDNDIYTAAMKALHGLGGILLKNANLDDLNALSPPPWERAGTY